MSKYSEMGDASIAQKVWTCLGAKGQPPCDGPHGVSNGKMLYVKDGVWVAFDPCNSWADAGPIIEQHNISLLCSTMCNQKAWEAMTPNGEEHWWEEKNPLRAAMIVFLMMNEATDEC